MVNKKEILVSAIVSTYNSERFIRGCLIDLIDQSIFDKIEIIVVDSGSKENEAGIVQKFQEKYDNIKYIRTSTGLSGMIWLTPRIPIDNNWLRHVSM